MKLLTAHTVFILAIIATAFTEQSSASSPQCACLNGGTCHSSSIPTCNCPSSFIGSACQIPSAQLSSIAIAASLSANYSYFHFSPSKVNYYRLTFTICMLSNPSKRGTLFYVDSQKEDGSLRETPSVFETTRIVLGDSGCTTFSSHYIGVKRKERKDFRRIVVGLKVMQKGQEQRYLNTYLNQQLIAGERGEKDNGFDEEEGLIQQITLKVEAEVYLQTSQFGTFPILFTAFTLLTVLLSFLSFLRRKYEMSALQLQLDTLHLQADLNRLRRQLQILNPQTIRPPGNHNLQNMEIFMPATHYGTPQTIFIPHLANKQHSSPEGEACSICLLEFQVGEEIRTTPCSHVYHRQCIDNWCQNRLSCPICRRQLDFTLQLQQLYYSFLLSDLQL